MKKFEEEKLEELGSDEAISGHSYRTIVKIADTVLGAGMMMDFIDEMFLTQKALGEYLGVGESTVAGWVKKRTFPDYAKRATLAAYYADKYFSQFKAATREASRPKVVKDGDRYMIVQFKTDEVGVAIGEVLARDIPTERAALIFAGGIRAFELLGRAEDVVDHAIETMDPEHSEWIQDLKQEITDDRLRTFAHDKALERHAQRVERERRWKEEVEELALNLSLDSDPRDTLAGEAGDE